MPMAWSVVFCVEVGFLAGGMRAEAVRFARWAVHTLFARTAGERCELGVNVSKSTPFGHVEGTSVFIRCAKV